MALPRRPRIRRILRRIEALSRYRLDTSILGRVGCAQHYTTTTPAKVAAFNSLPRLSTCGPADVTGRSRIEK